MINHQKIVTLSTLSDDKIYIIFIFRSLNDITSFEQQINIDLLYCDWKINFLWITHILQTIYQLRINKFLFEFILIYCFVFESVIISFYSQICQNFYIVFFLFFEHFIFFHKYMWYVCLFNSEKFSFQNVQFWFTVLIAFQFSFFFIFFSFFFVIYLFFFIIFHLNTVIIISTFISRFFQFDYFNFRFLSFFFRFYSEKIIILRYSQFFREILLLKLDLFVLLTSLKMTADKNTDISVLFWNFHWWRNICADFISNRRK